MAPAETALRRVCERVLQARAAHTALEIRGGGTKNFYGQTVRGDVLEVRELTGVTCYEPTELVVTALAGTPLSELEGLLAERGQYLPFEPPRFAAAGTVGGMVAAGLSGPARASVGPLRDFVLGVTLLTGNGELLRFGGQVMKNVAGYDVSRLIAGSLGILGVICDVSLKVMPLPPARRTLIVEMDEAAALARLNRWAGQGFPLSASAWHGGRLWIRLAGAQAAVDFGADNTAGRALEPAAADAWWSDIRDQRHAFFQFTPAQLAAGECLWRLALPEGAPVMSLPGEQFIEWGGALRWWRSAAPAATVRAAADAQGGHATLMRAADKSPGVFTRLPDVSMAVHRRLKQSFDPAGIFNPGRLYADL